MSHAINLSKLIRRKPNLNVSVLSFDWKESDPMSTWTSVVHKYFALDPKAYDYGRKGYLRLEKEGTNWFASFGYNVIWEDGWDSHYPPVIKIKVGDDGIKSQELKRNAELLYKQIMVPFLLVEEGLDKAETIIRTNPYYIGKGD